MDIDENEEKLLIFIAIFQNVHAVNKHLSNILNTFSLRHMERQVVPTFFYDKQRFEILSHSSVSFPINKTSSACLFIDCRQSSIKHQSFSHNTAKLIQSSISMSPAIKLKLFP